VVTLTTPEASPSTVFVSQVLLPPRRHGRHVAGGTDIRMSAEILSYSRSKGIFGGVSLDGTVVQADKSGARAMYGDEVNRHEILSGKVSVPESARPLEREIGRYVKEAKAS
jgi:SH3 domain-containing YSC84-like protein 1